MNPMIFSVAADATEEAAESGSGSFLDGLIIGGAFMGLAILAVLPLILALVFFIQGRTKYCVICICIALILFAPGLFFIVLAVLAIYLLICYFRGM